MTPPLELSQKFIQFGDATRPLPRQDRLPVIFFRTCVPPVPRVNASQHLESLKILCTFLGSLRML